MVKHTRLKIIQNLRFVVKGVAEATGARSTKIELPSLELAAQ